MIRFQISATQNQRHRGRTEGIGAGYIAPSIPQMPFAITRVGFARLKQGAAPIERKASKETALELILAGNMSYTQRGMTQIVQAGELFVLRAGPHRYEVGPAGFMHKRYITIGGPLLDNMLEKVGLGQQSRVQLKDPARIEHLFRRVRHIAVRKAPGHQIDLAVLLCRMLIEIGRSTQPEHPFAVSKVIEFLRRDVAHNPSLAELAKVAGMSQSHFSRVFKNSVGMSPLRYLDDTQPHNLMS